MAKKREKIHSEHGKEQFRHSPQNLEHAILKNLVELQKIHTDLAEKFDKLSHEISQMLALFELTARTFAKNSPVGDYEKDREFLDKIDKLLEQNKVLAKGLMLMEERLRERMYGFAPGQPQAKEPEKKTSQETNGDEFQPSITSPNRPLPRF